MKSGCIPRTRHTTGGELKGVRARPRQSGRRDAVALARRQGWVGSAAVGPTWWAAAGSDLAIETALTLRLAFHLPLRQTEGFVRSILTVMRASLAPLTTRRSHVGVNRWRSGAQNK